jgi:hypothetical protein
LGAPLRLLRKSERRPLASGEAGYWADGPPSRPVAAVDHLSAPEPALCISTTNFQIISRARYFFRPFHGLPSSFLEQVGADAQVAIGLFMPEPLAGWVVQRQHRLVPAGAPNGFKLIECVRPDPLAGATFFSALRRAQSNFCFSRRKSDCCRVQLPSSRGLRTLSWVPTTLIMQAATTSSIEHWKSCSFWSHRQRELCPNANCPNFSERLVVFDRTSWSRSPGARKHGQTPMGVSLRDDPF